MSKKPVLFKKMLVIGVIILLVGISITSQSFASNIVKKSPIIIFKGETLYVGGTGEGNYSNIQDAIDNASDGDTVFVFSGTYYENIVVYKTINLIGENKNTTIIDGNYSGDVIYVSANWVNISGFTIQNSGYEAFDLGVYIYSSYCVIKSNIIINNNQGIYLKYSSYNKINNNIIVNREYGIYLQYSCSYNKINNNIISYNYKSGLILMSSCNYNIIKDNNFSKNDVKGIYFVWNSNYNQVLYNIVSGSIWGISMDICQNCDIIGNTINNNSCGVYIRSSSNILICNNLINKNIGHAAYLIASSNITVKSNIISETYSNEINGVGLLLSQLNNSSITQNSVIANVRGFLIINSSFCFISQNNISNNSIDGINFRSNSRNNIVEENLFFNNYYGVYFYSYTYNSRNNIVEENLFLNNYYGIFIYRDISNNTFYHNNFINNTENAYDRGNNIWDNGYPSGGNYWDDYAFDDNNHGENQDIPGYDRIGDEPYIISGGSNKDNYPVTELNGWLNSAPENITIDGPTYGKPGKELFYTAISDDPEDDPLYYLFDWGDGTNSSWQGVYFSGINATVNHSWDDEGEYKIRIKAKDTRGFESDWLEFEVSIPRTRASSYHWFLERFPLLERLLNTIFFEN